MPFGKPFKTKPASIAELDRVATAPAAAPEEVDARARLAFGAAMTDVSGATPSAIGVHGFIQRHSMHTSMTARARQAAPRALSVALFLVAACQSPEGALASHRAQAEALLKKYAAVATSVAALPRPPAPQPVVPPDALDFYCDPPDETACNASFIRLEALVGDTGVAGFSAMGPVRLAWVRSLLATGRYPTNKHNPDGRGPESAADVNRVFDAFENVRYLFVLRTHRWTAPTMVGKTTYAGGTLDADVLLFDLDGPDGPTHLGGFQLRADSTDTIHHSGGTANAAIAFNLVKVADREAVQGVQALGSKDVPTQLFVTVAPD